MSDRPSDKAIAQAFWETDALEPDFHPGALYTDYVVRRAREIDAAKTVADTQWVMVPKKPTVTMVTSAIRKHWNGAVGDLPLAAMYKAMTMAAPTPPKAEPVAYCDPNDLADQPSFYGAWAKHLRPSSRYTTPLYSAPQAPTPSDDVIRDAERLFEAGWRVAAQWANRDDLLSDIGSGAYVQDRDAAIREQQRGEKDSD